MEYEGTLYTAVIDQDTISYQLPSNVVLDELVPIITTSDKATVVPASRSKRNFEQLITYTVTAEDRTTKTYNVFLTKTDSDTSIFTFEFSNLPEGQASYRTIAKEPADLDTIINYIPYLSPIEGLTSNIYLPDNASIEPASGETLDYTDPILYTVTAEDGSQREYLVFVDNALAELKINQSITVDSYKSNLPGAEVSIQTNILNPVQDSVRVSLVTIDGELVQDLTVQRLDQENNEIKVLLPDPYTNDVYRFKVAIEHDNEVITDGFVLNYGAPSVKALGSYTDLVTGAAVPHETLTMPGETFTADLYIDKSRFEDYGFFIRKNGQDYEFADVALINTEDRARFAMPDLPGIAPTDGSDFDMVIKVDGSEFVYPLLNSENNPIQVNIGKQAIYNGVDKKPRSKVKH